MMRTADVMRRTRALFFCLLLVVFVFGFAFTSAQDADAAETVDATIDFNEDIAGIDPRDWYYFLDFTHTPEEYYHEAGVCIEDGDIEEAQTALDGLSEALHDEEQTIEQSDIYTTEGVTIETLTEHPAVEELANDFSDAVTYYEYLENLETVLEEQAEIGTIEATEVETVLDDAQVAVADVNAAIEDRRVEVIENVAGNSDASTFEVGNEFQDYVYEGNPLLEDRFRAIANTQTVQEVRDQIVRLRQEALDLEEAGETENADAILNLIGLAERHAAECLHSSEEELNALGGFGHLQEVEQLVENAEEIVEGVPIEELNEDVIADTIPPTVEELVLETEREEQIAAEVLEDYESLNERYADNPVRLAALEQERERAERAQQLGQQLQENGVMERWVNELTAEGLEGRDLGEAIHARWTTEWENVYGDVYVPIGSYVSENPVEEQETSTQEVDVIPIGRIELIETIDPETGEITREIQGWVDGARERALGSRTYPIGVPIEDPDTGITYTFTGEGSYTYVTEAGISYTVEAPDNYAYSPENQYNFGDETFTYSTEDGNEITYSTTGVQVVNEEGEIVTDQAYTEETVTFADNSFIDNEPFGYAFNNNDGDAHVYTYNPETRSYTDTDGKVYVPPTPSAHVERTGYNSETGKYNYNYGGAVWSTSGDGTWISPSGQSLRFSVVPAPVGYEDTGVWTTPSGKTWVYDSVNDQWTESTTGVSYSAAPNNQYRYDEEGGRYVDSRGNWYDSTDTGAIGPWSYNTESNRWVSRETNDEYDPSTGVITHPDGTVSRPEDRPSQGPGVPCYGCYYDSSGQSSAYTYDYGGYYERNPQGSYNYYNSEGHYSGSNTATDAQGNTWTRNDDGSWTSSSGVTYAPGQGCTSGCDQYSSAGSGGWSGGSGGGGSSEWGWSSPDGNWENGAPTYYGPGGYQGGGGYDASGNYVGGSYGNYDASGAYTGGASYTQNPDGTWSSSGGDSGGGYSYSGGSTTGGESGSSTSGGESGGSTSGESGGSSGGDSGGTTSGGAVIAEEDAQLNNWFIRLWKKWFGD